MDTPGWDRVEFRRDGDVLIVMHQPSVFGFSLMLGAMGLVFITAGCVLPGADGKIFAAALGTLCLAGARRLYRKEHWTFDLHTDRLSVNGQDVCRLRQIDVVAVWYSSSSEDTSTYHVGLLLLSGKRVYLGLSSPHSGEYRHADTADQQIADGYAQQIAGFLGVPLIRRNKAESV
jgi:hypothetical protein